MALETQFITLDLELGSVRVMAIRAHDSRPIHLALKKRAVDVDFIIDLSISVIEALLQNRNSVSLVDRLPVLIG